MIAVERKSVVDSAGTQRPGMRGEAGHALSSSRSSTRPIRPTRGSHKATQSVTGLKDMPVGAIHTHCRGCPALSLCPRLLGCHCFHDGSGAKCTQSSFGIPLDLILSDPAASMDSCHILLVQRRAAPPWTHTTITDTDQMRRGSSVGSTTSRRDGRDSDQ